MANAGGRLTGAILSALIYQSQGLTGCLWWSAGFVLMAAIMSACWLLLKTGHFAPDSKKPHRRRPMRRVCCKQTELQRFHVFIHHFGRQRDIAILDHNFLPLPGKHHFHEFFFQWWQWLIRVLVDIDV